MLTSSPTLSNPGQRPADLNLLEGRGLAQFTRQVLSNRQFKQQIEKTTLTNIAILEGGYHQWKMWNKAGNELTLPDKLRKSEEKLVSFNITLQVVENIIARMGRGDAVPRATPVSTDANDVRVARLLTDLMGYEFVSGLRMAPRRARMLLAACCAPVVWQHGYWDAYAGKMIRTTVQEFMDARVSEIYPYGTATVNPLEIEIIRKQAELEFREKFGEAAFAKGRVAQHEGALGHKTYLPMSMSWYPWEVQVWDDVYSYVVHTRALIECVAEKYKMTIDEVRRRNTGGIVASRSGMMDLTGLSATRHLRRENEQADSGELVDVYEVYYKVTEQYDEGVQGVILGNDSEAIRVGPLDNHSKILPFFPDVQIEIPDRAWGQPIISHIRTLQRDLNDALTMESIFRQLHTLGIWYVPKEGIVDHKADWRVPQRGGECRQVNGAANVPVMLKRSDTAQSFGETTRTRTEMIEQTASVPASASGKVGDRESGRTVHATNQYAAQRSRPWIERLDAEDSALWTFYAEEMQTKPVGQRYSQIVGETNKSEIRLWTRESIRPTTFGTSNRFAALVRIATDMDEPMAAPERRNYTLSLIESIAKLGLRIPEEDVFRMIGKADMKLLTDRDRVDSNAQNTEIEQWRQGLMVPDPMPEEGHSTHIREIEMIIRSGEFREIIQAFPYLEQHIRAHLRRHEILRAKQLIRPLLIEERARAEAYMDAQREMQEDLAMGTVDAQVAQMAVPQQSSDPMTGEPTQEPSLIFNLANVLRLTPGAPSGAPSSAGKPGGPAPAAQGKKPGDGEQRNVHSDLASMGYDRKNLVAV